VAATAAAAEVDEETAVASMRNWAAATAAAAAADESFVLSNDGVGKDLATAIWQAIWLLALRSGHSCYIHIRQAISFSADFHHLWPDEVVSAEQRWVKIAAAVSGV